MEGINHLRYSYPKLCTGRGYTGADRILLFCALPWCFSRISSSCYLWQPWRWPFLRDSITPCPTWLPSLFSHGKTWILCWSTSSATFDLSLAARIVTADYCNTYRVYIKYSPKHKHTIINGLIVFLQTLPVKWRPSRMQFPPLLSRLSFYRDISLIIYSASSSPTTSPLIIASITNATCCRVRAQDLADLFNG